MAANQQRFFAVLHKGPRGEDIAVRPKGSRGLTELEQNQDKLLPNLRATHIGASLVLAWGLELFLLGGQGHASYCIDDVDPSTALQFRCRGRLPYNAGLRRADRTIQGQIRCNSRSWGTRHHRWRLQLRLHPAARHRPTQPDLCDTACQSRIPHALLRHGGDGRRQGGELCGNWGFPVLLSGRPEGLAQSPRRAYPRHEENQKRARALGHCRSLPRRVFLVNSWGPICRTASSQQPLGHGPPSASRRCETDFIDKAPLSYGFVQPSRPISLDALRFLRLGEEKVMRA